MHLVLRPPSRGTLTNSPQATTCVAGLVTPAVAAELAQDATSHKCAVTGKKPDGKSMMMVGTATFKSRPDVMKDMKDMSECKVL